MRNLFLLFIFLPFALGAQTADADCYGRVFPERADDLAWENDVVAFRAYGPATQQKGERAYGYDIFFKYPGKGLVLETLYGNQCSAENWAKVDSLNKIDWHLGKDFENSFTYHIDHGLGMDCYAVGSTLGAGAPALMQGDSICYSWCYESVEILQNGPERFVARMTFAPRAIGGDTAVVETRTITLERGAHLNQCEVRYEGLTQPVEVATGFPLRDEHPYFTDSEHGIIAYSDPTQGSDNGHAMLGAIVPGGFERVLKADGHILGIRTLQPGETFEYSFGYAWDKTDIKDFNSWLNYLATAATLSNPT